MSGLPWFRFFTEALDDDDAIEMPANAFKVWVLALCMATRHDGVIPSADRIARRLGTTVDRLKPSIDVLTASGRLIEQDDKTYRANDYEARVFRSDYSTERVQKWRENAAKNAPKNAPPKRPRGRPRKAVKSETLHETLHVTPGVTLHETLQRAPKKIGNVTDTDTESDSDTESDKREGAAKSPRKRDALWDAIVSACGIDPYATLTETEASRTAKAVGQIRRAGGTPDEVADRARRYVAKYEGAALTPLALAGHWGEMATEPMANGKAANGTNGTRQHDEKAARIMASAANAVEQARRMGASDDTRGMGQRSGVSHAELPAGDKPGNTRGVA